MESRGILLYYLWITVSLIPVTKLNECPAPLSTRIPGDVELIGMFSLHLPSSQRGTLIGQPHKDQLTPALLTAEAVIWALEGLNRHDFIPGVRLGITVYDIAGSRQLAASVASITYQKLNKDSGPYPCRRPSNASLIAGIVGPGRSNSAEIVSNVLKGTDIPVLSYSSTSNALRDVEEHPNLLFTVESDRHQVQAMVEILKALGWDYVAIVYTNENYGINGYQELKAAAQKEGICIATPRIGNYSIPLATSSDRFDRIISDLVQSGTRGVIFFGLQEYGKRLLEASARHQDAPSLLMWIFSEALANNNAFSGQTLYALQGGLAVASATKQIPTFQKYFVDLLFNITRGHIVTDLRRVWLEEYTTAAFSCKLATALEANNQHTRNCSTLSRTEIQDVVEAGSSLYLENGLKAAYAYAASIRNAHSELCNSPGVCSSLRDMTPLQWMRYLSGLNITLTNHDIPFLPPELFGKRLIFEQHELTFNPESPIYKIRNYQKDRTIDVGFFDGRELVLNTSNIIMYRYDSNNQPVEVQGENLDRSTCPRKCAECVRKSEVKVAYKPGQHLILGVFPIHSSDCTTIRPTASVQLLEAFLFAMEQISQRKGVMQNISQDLDFGYLALDDCYDEFKALQIACDIYSGKQFGDITIDRNSLIGWIGPLSSGNCRPIASTLRHVHDLQISYGSTIEDFNDRNLYPYFMRTVPTDEQLTRAILSICQQMGWTYVSIIHASHDYGRSLRDSTLKYLLEYGICNATVLEQNTVTDDHLAFSILEASKNGAKVVLILTDALNARALIGTIQRFTISLDDDNLKDLVFIGTESWADRESVVEGYETLTKGAITFKFNKGNVPGFDSYFKTKTLQNNKQNPWFNEFWEQIFDCNLEGNFNKTRKNTCKNDLNLTDYSNYHQDSLVAFVTDAVYSLALGFDSLYKTKCGPNFDPSCTTADFISFKNRKETFTGELMKKVKNVNMPGRGAMYSENGSGMTGYTILQWSEVETNQWRYVEIGSYSPSSGINIAKDKLLAGLDRSVKSVCRGEACAMCRSDPPAPVTLSATGVGAVVMASLAVLLILTVVVLVCMLVKMKRQLENVYGPNSYDYAEVSFNRQQQHVQMERNLPQLPMERDMTRKESAHDQLSSADSGYINAGKNTTNTAVDDSDVEIVFENDSSGGTIQSDLYPQHQERT
ncbi:uncharacterized protein LOC106153255 [Lingula anatina]|uniref:Uncharacterized protein LOC106153255 n=1 Tax=Lingula anatina TaxID=7574 RepID=A0A1S3H991_LINAN|nr:uncharacterized protein LOC106153255 [Lingula anatina]|eukprot:XP_013382567.1 uncharacterized protein LOC106153255 [Lingula anatina]